MSEMSYLEKLLDGVKVEWLPLGEITKYEQPTKYLVKAKDYHDTYTIPVLTAGKTFILGYTNETHGIYQASKAPVIIFDDFTTANKWVDFDFKAKSSAMKMVTSCDDNKTLLKYVYYWLNTLPSEFAEGDHKRQWISNYSQKKIPIPCPGNPEKSLAIQSEIVRILDKFTALTAELTAELNMRKKQYNYYRDQLLNLEGRENTREMRIGDIYDFQYGTGNTIPKSGGQYPVYGSNGIVGSHDKYNSEDSPVIGHIGAYAGIVNWGQGKHFVTYNGVICRHKSKEVLQKYAYYLLLLQDFGSKSNSASQPFVSYNILNAPIVLVPPLQEQARIVAILDKFDTLTNSITEGLPREIELRQKQYEYYRDLLFSFPKPETASN
ncbi:restriction endonuclease subunit S [Escherichia albertii]|uniref:restriction endonuclease subunit S n=2 Tax=Escherichia TaxID=561 RepID=UPI00198E15AF|nr:restriction endonuclease subunit S [Escherichia coli]HAN4398709.1 restriction endonuclease subunit S [Escherichia coli]HBA5837540.1 restriction endonuclease subunit S [Escherichia coli]